MSDKLSRENAIRLFDLFFPKHGLLRDEKRQCDWMAKKVHAEIKSLLTPVPEEEADKIKDDLALILKGYFIRWREQFSEENKDIDELPLQNAKNIVNVLLKKFEERKEGKNERENIPG